jgi:hypothetical protein
VGHRQPSSASARDILGWAAGAVCDDVFALVSLTEVLPQRSAGPRLQKLSNFRIGAKMGIINHRRNITKRRDRVRT